MKRIFTPARKRAILILDDDPVLLRIYREGFLRAGFTVEVAENSGGALDKIARGEIDLVLVDLCLPEINALEFLKSVRAQATAEALPIIAFANRYLTNMGRTALEAGATKCLIKGDAKPGDVFTVAYDLLGRSYSGAGDGEAALETQIQNELAPTFNERAAGAVAKLRAGHQNFSRTEDPALRHEQLSGMHRQIRVLGLSRAAGWPNIAQISDAMEALVLELQAKPKKITPSVLRTIAQAVDTLAVMVDRSPHPQDETLPAAKVLVVDDEVISRETICSALAKANLEATALDDSLAAEQLLQQEHFGLIFLDVEMPGLTGFQLCVKIRELAINRTTPVVFVTAHSDFANRAQSALSGGNDFIAKPFLSVELAVKTLTCLFKTTARTRSIPGAQGESDASKSIEFPAGIAAPVPWSTSVSA